MKIPENPNRLLSRQLKKTFPDGELTNEGMNKFIELVNEVYYSHDEDRLIYQRAEQISNRELEKTNEELQIKNDFLDTFNHGMAHDVKNHTSNIIGLVNMLKKYSEKQNIDMIKQINQQLEMSANQLTSIVQGFLYLSRSESKIDNQFTIIKKDELIEFINLEIQFLTKGKNVTINYNFNLNDLFFSRHILKIIFVNLISNSIKYSKPNKECIINVSLTHDFNNLELKVEDNGIGIDMKHAQKKLYNLFNQPESSENKGFGVGLFLIKKITDRNNGTINFNSELNVGTQVAIKFPLEINK